MQSPVLGFQLVLVAAIAGGGLAVPLKKRRSFELENIYIPCALVMMLALPFALAAFVLPHWTDAMRAAGIGTIWAGAGYGFGWGVGSILFGYGVTLAGMSVGFAIIMGINTAVGSILPFIVISRADLLTPGGEVILSGIAGCVIGVAICGMAGVLRQRQAKSSGEQRRFGAAFLVCVAAGVLSSCANLGFAFTSRVGDEALRLGASPAFSTLASWMPVFWGAAVALLVWFGGLQLKRGTWRKNFGPNAGHDWLLGVLMGVIWFVATIPYGMGAFYLGHLGTTVGWAVYMAFTLLVANAFGFMTNEWTNAPQRARKALYAGLLVLVVAVVILAVGNSMTVSLRKRPKKLTRDPQENAVSEAAEKRTPEQTSTRSSFPIKIGIAAAVASQQPQRFLTSIVGLPGIGYRYVPPKDDTCLPESDEKWTVRRDLVAEPGVECFHDSDSAFEAETTAAAQEPPRWSEPLCCQTSS